MLLGRFWLIGKPKEKLAANQFGETKTIG